MMSWMHAHMKKPIKRHYPEGYTVVSDDERNPPPSSGINIFLIVASIASFLAVYTFTDLTSTIKNQGADIKKIRDDMSAVSEWKNEMSKWQDSVNSRMLGVEAQVATDEAYLGIRRPTRKESGK